MRDSLWGEDFFLCSSQAFPKVICLDIARTYIKHKIITCPQQLYTCIIILCRHYLSYRHSVFYWEYSVPKTHTILHPGPEWHIFHTFTNEDVDDNTPCFYIWSYAPYIQPYMRNTGLWGLMSLDQFGNTLCIVHVELIFKELFYPKIWIHFLSGENHISWMSTASE